MLLTPREDREMLPKPVTTNVTNDTRGVLFLGVEITQKP